MRFLMFAASEFEEKPELQGKKDLPFGQFLESSFSLSNAMNTVICFALAYCFHPSGLCLASFAGTPVIHHNQ